MLPVINLDAEFALNSVVDEYARLDVHLIVLSVPVSLKSDGHAIPTVGVDVAKTVTAHLDDALGHDVWLLVQMDVVLVRVVEGAHGTEVGDLLKTKLLGHRLECLHEHFIKINYLV